MPNNIFETFLTELQEEVDKAKTATESAKMFDALLAIQHLIAP